MVFADGLIRVFAAGPDTGTGELAIGCEPCYNIGRKDYGKPSFCAGDAHKGLDYGGDGEDRCARGAGLCRQPAQTFPQMVMIRLGNIKRGIAGILRD